MPEMPLALAPVGTLDLLLSITTTVVILKSYAMLFSTMMFPLTGYWVNAFEWWLPASLSHSQSFVRLWLLSPLVDMAETVG